MTNANNKRTQTDTARNLITVWKNKGDSYCYMLHIKIEREKLWCTLPYWKNHISNSKHTCICNGICMKFNHERIICCDTTTTETLTINKAYSGTQRCKIFSPMQWWNHQKPVEVLCSLSLGKVDSKKELLVFKVC